MLAKKYDVFKTRNAFFEKDSLKDVLATGINLLNKSIVFEAASAYINLKERDYVKVPLGKTLTEVKAIKKNKLTRDIVSYFDTTPIPKVINNFTKKHHSIFSNRISPNIKNILFIPIFGQKRLVGVVAVINLESISLTVENEKYISYLGTQLSHYCSYHLRKEVLTCLEQISQCSIKSINDNRNKKEYIQKVSEVFTNNNIINYKAVVIRTFSENKNIDDIGRSGRKINWDSFNSRSTKDKQGLAGLVLKTGQRLIIEDVNSDVRFYNKEWAIKNELISYICEPILIGGFCIGTISAFISYPYQFYDLDYNFLSVVANNISVTFCALDQYSSLNKEHHANEGEAVTTIDDLVSIKEFAHRYKNDLISCGILISKITERSSGFVHREAVDMQNFLTSRQEELEKYLVASSGDLGKKEYFSLNDLCKDVVKSLEDEMKSSKIKADYNLGEIVDLRLNKPRIRASLHNLLQNSIKAIEQRGAKTGRITISTYLDYMDKVKCITVEINDTGCGIDNGVIESQIFKEGFSGFKAKSTGKGLFAAKRVIEEHYGNIFAINTGNGTSFKLQIPIPPFR